MKHVSLDQIYDWGIFLDLHSGISSSTVGSCNPADSFQCGEVAALLWVPRKRLNFSPHLWEAIHPLEKSQKYQNVFTAQVVIGLLT